MELLGYFDPQIQGGVVALILFFLVKIIPNEKLYKLFDGLGIAVTLGMSRFKWWEKVETFGINGFDVCWQGFVHGLRSDNSKENARNRDKEYTPAKKA